MKAGLIKAARSWFQRMVQTRIWRMDIHPSARIEPTALIDRTFPQGIHIGPDCYVGEEAVVLTHDFTRGLYLHTRIGARCHLGPRAIVMPGLTLGEDCMVMPGALVTKDMPANTLAVGNPASVTPRDSGSRS
jgi:acetyltransferase-like isoleucine patch superfamily enzyme